MCNHGGLPSGLISRVGDKNVVAYNIVLPQDSVSMCSRASALTRKPVLRRRRSRRSRLDPQSVAKELNERAVAIAAQAGESGPSREALDRARRELVSKTEEQLRDALGLLGL